MRAAGKNFGLAAVLFQQSAGFGDGRRFEIVEVFHVRLVARLINSIKKTVPFAVVIPAKAGIQVLIPSWIPARASYRRLGRNDEVKRNNKAKNITVRAGEES